MRIKLFIIATAVLLLSCSNGFAQKKWTLKQCIEYAIDNNIQVQQSELAVKQGEIQLNTSKNSRLPSLSASLGGNMAFGRGTSRTGETVDNSQFSSSFSANLNVPIYEGSRIRNTILVNELNLKSSIQRYERTKEDLSLNIVSLYMQILFSQELLMVAESQLTLSETFVERNKVLYENGRVPESEYYESVSLMARDKLTVTEANNALILKLLDLAQALNMPNADGFDIVPPSIEEIDKQRILGLTPASEIYEVAVRTRPSVLSEEFRLLSYEQSLKVAKSAYYPNISAGAGYGNSYYNSFGSSMPNTSFINQMETNGNENIGVNISIPIFNRFSTRNRVRLANIDINNQTLALRNVKLNLQKEIEQSYYNAEASRRKYEASHEAMKAAEIAFKYEEQKSLSGRSTIFDFNDSKTRLVQAESELLSAKYEYLFNKKILDFYYGIPLTK